jgi:hypothetical protein
MKFLQILGYATLAMALPSAAPQDNSLAVIDLDKRATVTGTLLGALNTLESAVTNNLVTIRTSEFLVSAG